MLGLLPTLLVREAGLSAAAAGAWTGAASLSAVGGSAWAAWWMRHGRHGGAGRGTPAPGLAPGLVLGLALPALLLFGVFRPAPAAVVAIGLAMAINLLGGLFAALAFAMLPRVAAPDATGLMRANGWFSQCGATGSLLGPPAMAACVEAAGWPAAAALGKKFPDDGPHLIYLPERTFVLERFLDDVRTMHQRHGRCVVAVSEGIHDASGAPILAQLAQDLERDAHGNVQLSGTGALADLLCEEIKQKLGIKRVRGDTFGYLQRSFIGCVSDVDQREAREVGEKAVQFAMWGDRDGSVAIQRTGYYSADYSLLPLDAVAGKTRVMDDAFISDSGTDVTDAFRLYLRPLLGSGLSDAYRLRPAPVAKVLNRGD